MTLTNVIAALIILGFFFAGFSQVVLPIHSAWDKAMFDLRTARTIQFIAESFRNECAKPDRNMDNWKVATAIAKELEECVISEIRQGGIVRALKASCIISGEYIEIIGLCTP